MPRDPWELTDELRLRMARRLLAGEVRLVDDDVDHWLRAEGDARIEALLRAYASREAARLEGVADIRASTHEVASHLLHELKPTLGLAMEVAESEVPEFPHSKTRRQLRRIETVVEALAMLRHASRTADWKSLNVAVVVEETIAAEVAGHDSGIESDSVEIHANGDGWALADEGLLTIGIRNVLRNAFDAVSEQEDRHVVVAFGSTDRDTWICVTDDGPGLPEGDLLAAGATTRRDKGHIGYGLAVVELAMGGLRGGVEVRNAATGGAEAWLRWPTDPEFSS